MTVAALFVDPRGVYSSVPDVDLWDEARDARLYAGPWPVVAHPPRARWCALAPLLESMYGYRVGDDDGCFAAALAAVRRWGGVLEHPAYSYAWRAFALPRPIGSGLWQRSLLDDAWVCEVDQAAYGHRARKRTWLYFVGADPEPVDGRRPMAAAMVSSFGHGAAVAEARRCRPAEAAATPAAFRDALLDLARACG